MKSNIEQDSDTKRLTIQQTITDGNKVDLVLTLLVAIDNERLLIQCSRDQINQDKQCANMHLSKSEMLALKSFLDSIVG